MICGLKKKTTNVIISAGFKACLNIYECSKTCEGLSVLLKPIFILFLLSAFSAASFATEYYVATDGNDSGDGQSLTTAWQTIGKANSILQPGDIVYIRSGVYSGSAKTYSIWVTPDGESEIQIADQYAFYPVSGAIVSIKYRSVKMSFDAIWGGAEGMVNVWDFDVV